jgi:hypothetical protein
MCRFYHSRTPWWIGQSLFEASCVTKPYLPFTCGCFNGDSTGIGDTALNTQSTKTAWPPFNFHFLTEFCHWIKPLIALQPFAPTP